METIDRTTRGPKSAADTTRTNRWLAIGLVLALAALVALGAWLLVDNLVKTDYETVIDDFHAAQNSGDGPGAAALFTDDGAFVDPDGLEYVGRANIRNMVDSLANRFQIEITGDTTTFGAYVAVPEKALPSLVTRARVAWTEGGGNVLTGSTTRSASQRKADEERRTLRYT